MNGIAGNVDMNWFYKDYDTDVYVEPSAPQENIPNISGYIGNSIVGALKNGESVTITQTDSATGWYKIKTSAGVVGYVSNKYIKVSGQVSGATGEDSGADKTVGDVVVAKFMGTETAGRYTYNVYEVQ